MEIMKKQLIKLTSVIVLKKCINAISSFLSDSPYSTESPYSNLEVTNACTRHLVVLIVSVSRVREIQYRW